MPIMSRHSPRTSVSSIGDKEDKLVESFLPAQIHGGSEHLVKPRFDKTQRRISHSMLNVLAYQGRQGKK